MRAVITANLEPLIHAQVTNALGLKYLVVRDKKTGKFLRVTDGMARAKQHTLKANEEIIEVWEKDPCVQALTDLLNRAIDKPAEHIAVQVEASDAAMAALDEGRRRNAEARAQREAQRQKQDRAS